ncbi:MAG: ferric-dicitrate binding protein FerR (iron transport regulator), partial [Myxococcota bacterium]
MHCQDLSQLVSAAPERASALPDALREHADQCLACQAQVHASQRLTGILAEAGEGYVPAPGLARQVLREVDARRKRPAPVRIWAPLASTLVLALCVGGTVWFAGSLGPQNPATAPEPTAQIPAPATGTSEPAPGLREHPGPTAAPVAPVAAAPTEHALKVANAEVVGGILETGKAERRTFVLSDGTTLSLNHDSRVRLLTDRPRALELVRGEAVLDVIKQEPLPPLLVELPTGTVRVVGTRLMVSALADRSVVDVLRGKVIAMNGAGSVPVTAGREAVLKSGVPPRARPAVGLAGATRWADVEAPAREGTMGIGTLTARRPGAKADTDQALRLTDHRVSLTTRGQLARTQIEEAFANDTAHTMEGIYSFPLPADARIAGLELLVDGTWMPGAMVARDRGDKIWAGVIRNATPKAQRKNNVEFVWIPGPWRDPAILNWKEGSRFELKIFPIPAHGERRVRIAYTQTLKRTPNGLRYVYPLADGADQAVADRFRFDARLGGVDSPKAVRSTPYEVESRQDDDSLVLKADIRRFRPRGDLVVDLPDPTGDEELRSWAYVDPNTDASYALLALRPELPAPSAEPDTVLFVVDASYSTQAERLNRAARLVSRVVGELSRTTEVAVLACATECRRLGGDFRPASSLVAADLQRRIGALQPLGATRLTHAVKQAATTLRRAGRETRARVVYIGDGMPSVGEIDPARIAKAARRALGDTPLTTVSTGGEVDDLVLRSLAE